MAEKQPKIMKIHALCKIFSQDEDGKPLMTAEEINRLREDIREHGVKVPILVNKKKDTILDGRTRWMLASEVGKTDTVRMDVFDGKDEDIKSEIFSRNILRRHLTDDQRVALVMKHFGKQWRAEAKEEQRKAGQAKAGKERGEKTGAFKKGEGVSVAQKAAEKAGVSVSKAKEAAAADKEGYTEDVIQKKKSLRQVTQTRRAKRKPRASKPAAPKPLDDRVWHAFNRMMNGKWLERKDQTEALKILRGFIDDILRTRDKKIERAESKNGKNGKANSKK